MAEVPANDGYDSDPRRPCMLLTCYHFHPSTEVASRRMEAVARAVESSGLDVLVISAFGGQPIPAGKAIWPGIIAFPVAIAPRLLVDTLVSLKRWLFSQPGSAVAGEPDARAIAAWQVRTQTQLGYWARLKNALLRLADLIDGFKKWGWAAHRQAMKAAAAHEVQFVFSSGPPFSGVLAAWRTSIRLRRPLVIDLRDPMAGEEAETTIAGRLDAWVLSQLERQMVRDAAAVTCASPGIHQSLLERYPDQAQKIHLVMNGFDGEVQQRPPTTGHRLNILFAGALYLNRNPFQVLESLERLLARPDVDASRVMLRFVGDCASYDGVLIADWLGGRRSKVAVEIVPPVTTDGLQPFIDEATVLLNLAQGQPRQIPAKTFEQLASGREILAICEADSDTGRLLATVPSVFRLTPGDSAALDAALADLYQRHVVEGQLRPIPADRVLQFSRKCQTDKLLAIARSLGAGR